MSVAQAICVVCASGAGVVITLDAGAGGLTTRLDGASPYNTIVGIRFNTNGQVQTGTRVNGDAITWTNDGVWIDPLSQADNSYSVRYTNKSGTPDFTSGPSEDTWTTLVDAVVTFTMQSTVEETISFTCDFEVRKTAGAPPTTASVAHEFRIQNLP